MGKKIIDIKMRRGEENQRQGGKKSKATQLFTPLQARDGQFNNHTKF